jgi:CheY-like chemotaxis protein
MSARARARLVLLVEDDRDMRAVLRLALDAPPLADLRPIRVVEAACADEALQHMRRARPDLILLDLGLPRVDGLQLTRRLRADPVFCRVPIIALSGLPDPALGGRARAAGCDHFLAKPADVAVLLELIRHTLRPIDRVGA